MSFQCTYRWGKQDADPTSEQLRALLDELELVDDEHPDVSVTHESEWCLSAFSSGLVMFENVAGDGEPRHLCGCTRDQMLAMFDELGRRDLSAVNARPWRLGSG